MIVEARDVPKWESELSGYLSGGDGMRCPNYSRCQYRLSGDWYPDYDKEYMNKRQGNQIATVGV